MKPLREWLHSEEYLAIDKIGMGELVSKEFFRDPLRPIHIMPEYFYAPADGVIVYAYENLGPTQAIVNIKGKNFDVRKALDDPDFDHPCMVIGIFMTSKDVHVQRCPTSGYLREARCTPFLYTPNISMISEEEELFDADIDKEDMEYLFCNERKVISIYYPLIRTTYFVIQIAEKDVDVILNWNKQGYMLQGERFGQVRFGSQVDLIIPLVGKTKYELLAKKGYHVEAGVDRLVRIINP